MGGVVEGLFGGSGGAAAAGEAATAGTAASAAGGSVANAIPGATEQIKDHTFGNFMNGYKNASSLGGIAANIGSGNIASGLGGMLRMGENAPDASMGRVAGLQQFAQGAQHQPQMQGNGMGGMGGGYQRGINSFRKQQY